MKKSGKAFISKNVLELTQKIQTLFPEIEDDIIQSWIGVPKDKLIRTLTEIFNKKPELKVYPKPLNPILKHIGNISLIADSRKFNSNNLRWSKEDLNISHLRDGFFSTYGDIEESVEKITETVFCCQELIKNMPDDLIIGEIGGEGKAETKIRHILDLLKKCADREETFLTKKYGNFFYVFTKKGNFGKVRIIYRDNGWDIIGFPWINDGKLPIGSRIFYPVSSNNIT